jgi:hypothetical protein
MVLSEIKFGFDLSVMLCCDDVMLMQLLCFWTLYFYTVLLNENRTIYMYNVKKHNNGNRIPGSTTILAEFPFRKIYFRSSNPRIRPEGSVALTIPIRTRLFSEGHVTDGSYLMARRTQINTRRSRSERWGKWCEGNAPCPRNAPKLLLSKTIDLCPK